LASQEPAVRQPANYIIKDTKICPRKYAKKKMKPQNGKRSLPFEISDLKSQTCSASLFALFAGKFSLSEIIYFLALPPPLPLPPLAVLPPLLPAADLLLLAAAPFAAPPELLAAPLLPLPPPLELLAAVPPPELFDFAALPALPVPFVPASPPGFALAALLAFDDFPAPDEPAFDETALLLPPPLEAPPLDFAAPPALPAPFVAESPLAFAAPPFEDELALFAFDEEPLLPLLLPPLVPAPLDFVDFPALSVPFVPASPPSITPLTASATTPKTPIAAPCAAPVRISPAASFALSRISPATLLLADFFPPLFDFAEVDFEPLDF
jgi:hypothetical protein